MGSRVPSPAETGFRDLSDSPRLVTQPSDVLRLEMPDGRVLDYNLPRVGMVRIRHVDDSVEELTIEAYEAREARPLL